MYRLVGLVAMLLACAATRAEAVEMFTNFHLGENVGFPPMQVPYGIYGGLGRGGWNPYAEGTPLKTWPPVPSMMPTGQVPGGFRRLNNGATRNGRPAANSHSSTNQQDVNRTYAETSESSTNAIAETPPNVSNTYESSRRPQPYEEIAANPRRGFWQRGYSNYSSNGNSYSTDENTSFDNGTVISDSVTPANAATTTTTLPTKNANNSPATSNLKSVRVRPQPSTTSLHAGEGKAPNLNTKLNQPPTTSRVERSD